MSHTDALKRPHRRPTRRVLLVLGLTASYMVAEAVGGFVSNSLSLLADAGHMLTDVLALSMSFFAFIIAARPASDKATFGYHRAEVLAAMFNGIALLIVSFFIIKEAIERFFAPEVVESELMFAVAFGGLLVNLIGLAILHRDRDGNINLRGAWLHVLSDTLGSVAVLISAILIRVFNLSLVDSIASIAIALLVIYSAFRLLCETISVLMEHVPAHIDPSEVKKEILATADAIQVHDLHIWSITPGKEALSVHVKAKSGADCDRLLKSVQEMLDEKFGIVHTTIQIEHQCLAQERK